MLWHKIYSSAHRAGDPTKADKDLLQAVTLAAILVEQQDVMLDESFREAPGALRSAVKRRLPRIKALLARHPQTLHAFAGLALGP
jgi:hypothetical protein